MPRRGQGWWTAGTVLLLGLSILGCQSTSRSRVANSSPAYTAYGSGGVPGPSATRLSPNSMVAWSISSGPNGSKPVMNSKELIAANGTLELGPYGTVPVSGMTIDQARVAVERHLANYLTEPRVDLQVVRDNEVASAAPKANAWGSAVQLDTPRPANVVAADYKTPNKADVLRAQAPSELTGDISTSDDKDKKDDKVFRGPEPARLHPEPMVPVPVVVGPDSVPRELRKINLPPYVVEPPDILLIELTQAANEGLTKEQVVRGQHLVRPDGTINLGIYGSVLVSGLTLDQIKEAVYKQLMIRLGKMTAPPQLQDLDVDVLAYNSKVYYVITDGGGYGEQVYRIPFTGNETVLDAFGQINGLPAVSSKKHIWVARRGENGSNRQLPVDWCGITQRGDPSTNFQVMPGDRIYVKADKWITFDNGLGKRLAPVERVLGATLLGSQTINSIRNRGTSGSGNGL
ncbi:MAG: polysaccharide biosynthesis/export family protein [Gemmataceae bacterium]